MERIGAAVIGGGAVGCAAAWQLAEAGLRDVFVLERNAALCEEQSGRSSGVVHAGIYYAPGSLKARLCPPSNAGMYEFCGKHGVPCEQTGKIVVAPALEDLPAMEGVFERAAANGVEGVERLTPAQVSALEPNLYVAGGLLVPSTGIVDAAALVKAFARLLEGRGGTVLTTFNVTRVAPRGGVFEVTGHREDGREEVFEAEVLVNAAGLECDVIGRMVDPGLDVRVVPMRGEYVKMSRARRKNLWLSGRNIYPVPETLDLGDDRTTVVGAHLTPTFGLGPDGTTTVGDFFTVGPEFVRAPSREDYETGRFPASHIVQRASRYFPSLSVEDVTLDYTGIMVHLAGHSDWMIRADDRYPNCIQLLGIESPGLTCSLEIGKMVRALITGGKGRG